MEVINKSRHLCDRSCTIAPNTAVPLPNNNPTGGKVFFQGQEHAWWGEHGVTKETFWWLTEEAHIIDKFSILPDKHNSLLIEPINNTNEPIITLVLSN